MYGLVNRAVQDLARSAGGDACWERIRARAGVCEPEFASLKPYPDELTYALVGAASEELGMPAEEMLVAFGRHWVAYTAEQGWGPVMTAAGDSLPAFLLGLESLHARVRLTMPQLRPPSFRCTEVTASSLRLHYFSERDGLAPMVIGLLRGLGERFGVDVDVVHAVAGAEDADHDQFVVAWS